MRQTSLCTLFLQVRLAFALVPTRANESTTSRWHLFLKSTVVLKTCSENMTSVDARKASWRVIIDLSGSHFTTQLMPVLFSTCKSLSKSKQENNWTFSGNRRILVRGGSFGLQPNMITTHAQIDNKRRVSLSTHPCSLLVSQSSALQNA